jgi:hypothetical protein
MNSLDKCISASSVARTPNIITDAIKKGEINNGKEYRQS